MTLLDFKTAQNLSPGQLASRRGDNGMTSDMMAWCEGVDQFGMLLWLASGVVL